MKAVFFDVGGTLLRAWPSVGAVYASVGGRYGLRANAEEMEQAFRAAWTELKATNRRRGVTVGEKDWWRRLVFRALEIVQPNHDFARRDEYFEELYEAFAMPDNWRVYPDVLETLQQVREGGRHVGLISNWDRRLRQLLEVTGLAPHFDSFSISCEVGAEKPAAEIFEAALRAAGVRPAEALHVGDLVEEDVRGATRVGLRAALIDRDGGQSAECDILNDLRRVIDLVRES